VKIDPKGQRALEEWIRRKDRLIAGLPRLPAGDAVGITLRELCNKYLSVKRTDVSPRKLSPRTFF